MLKVLLMDDEPRICKLLHMMIPWESLGFQIVGESYDSLDGLEKYKVLRPDIVILDIRMPGMNGITLIGKMKEVCAQAEFVIISGYKDFEYAREAMQLGVQSYLLKPVDPEELKTVLLSAKSSIEQQNTLEQEITEWKRLVNDGRQRLAEYYFSSLLSAQSGLQVAIDQVNAEYSTHFVSGFYRVLHCRLDGGKAGGQKESLSAWFMFF